MAASVPSSSIRGCPVRPSSVSNVPRQLQVLREQVAQARQQMEARELDAKTAVARYKGYRKVLLEEEARHARFKARGKKQDVGQQDMGREQRFDDGERRKRPRDDDSAEVIALDDEYEYDPVQHDAHFGSREAETAAGSDRLGASVRLGEGDRDRDQPLAGRQECCGPD